MKVRVFSSLALVLFLLAPARSAEPAFSLCVRSIEGLIEDVKFLAVQAGKEEEAKQFEGVLRSQLGDKGLKGIDIKKPLGAYSFLTPPLDSSPVVVLVPIADEKAFVDFLENFNLAPKKDGDGIYTVTPEKFPVSIHFRFANQYAYFTAPDKGGLAKDKLLDPSKALGEKATLSAVLNIDRVPQEFKTIALAVLDQGLAKEQERKRAGETEVQKRSRDQILKEVAKNLAAVVNDGGRLSLRLNIDRQTGEITEELSLSGKPNSKLAADIAGIGQGKSRFGILLKGDVALSSLIHVSLPAEVRQALGPIMDEGFAKVLEKEQDEGRRALAKKVLDAIKPTLKQAEIDAGFRLNGPSPDGHYTVLAGLKLKDGAKIDQAVRELVKTMLPGEMDLIRFDAEKAGAVSIHRVDAHKHFDAKTRQALGDNPLYLAVLDDALLLGAGPDGLKIVKQATAAEPEAAPLLHFEVSLARLARTMAEGDKEREKKIVAAAEKVFTQAGSDKVSITVTGGQALQARLMVKAPVIRFLAVVGNQAKAE